MVFEVFQIWQLYLIIIMVNASQIKYYLYYYRYNIAFPGIIGGIVLYDYLYLKRKKEIALRKAKRLEEKAKALNSQD